MSMHKARKMKILLPVDASPYSAEAVRAVATRPWPAGSTVRVLSSVEIPGPPPVGEMMYDAGASLALRQQGIKKANQLTKRVVHTLTAAGLEAEAVVRDGDPRSVIVDEAEAWKADLIVVGSHGYTGIKKLLLGSVAQSVVSHASCSVEVVRSKAAKKTRRAA